MIEYIVKVYENGNIEWFKKEKRHNGTGPAVVLKDGTSFWYREGNLHNETGPAIQYANGSKAWYLNNTKYTEKQWERIVNPPKEVTIAELEKILGYTIKVVK